MDDISDLISQYDKDFTTERPGSPGTATPANRRPGIEALDDGSYTFEIVDAKAARVNVKGVEKAFVRLGLKVEEKGITVEHSYWLENQIAVNLLGADLKTLGLPADAWTGCFSGELMGLLRRGDLIGRRFKGKKVTQKGDTRSFHKLYVNWPLGRSAATPHARPVPPHDYDAPVATSDEDIPF